MGGENPSTHQSETPHWLIMVYNPSFNLRLQINSLYNEISILSKLKHARIVEYIGMEDTPLSIVLEFVPGGSLKDKLNDGPLTEATAKSHTILILEGLEYLHWKHFIHRDLKGTITSYSLSFFQL